MESRRNYLKRKFGLTCRQVGLMVKFWSDSVLRTFGLNTVGQ